MKAVLNNVLHDMEDGNITPSGRAFRYGDGLFETVAVCDGIPRLLARHLHRLRMGAAVIGLDAEYLTDDSTILSHCRTLHKIAKNPARGILRLYLFREGEGQYAPAGSTASMLITFEAAKDQGIAIAQRVGFAETVFNFNSPTSMFKTMSALHYVMAGMEKTRRALDDIILLDLHGNVSESLSANIFWKIGNSYFTPSLQTGCIGGIMRGWLMEKLKEHSIPVHEVQTGAEVLGSADSVFVVNALGIKHFLTVDGFSFETDPLSTSLIQSIS